jgi:hypothetical protein
MDVNSGLGIEGLMPQACRGLAANDPTPAFGGRAESNFRKWQNQLNEQKRRKKAKDIVP